MGFPVNEDNTLDYSPAAPTPTRLTDGAAEYVAPSEAALEAAKDLIYSGIDGGLGELVIGNPIVLAVAYSALEEAEATENDLCLMFAHALDRFAAQQAAAVEAERARYNALKAVADSMAKAVRGVKADAVYQNGYEGNDYEYPVHVVDSDYTHELYKALAEYEKATDPAPQLTI